MAEAQAGEALQPPQPIGGSAGSPLSSLASRPRSFKQWGFSCTKHIGPRRGALEERLPLA
jgi:hypothetical protein